MPSILKEFLRRNIKTSAMLSNIGDIVKDVVHTYMPINEADLAPKKV